MNLEFVGIPSFNPAMQIHRLFACAALLGACSCSTTAPPLRVKTFVLRDQERDTGSDPWARMEKESRLRGAISMEERKERLGQYFTVLWSDPDGAGEPVTAAFEYRQGGSASAIRRKTATFAAGSTEGRAVFAVTGRDYTTNGRVLAWQVRLLRGKREIASQRSYLWR